MDSPSRRQPHEAADEVFAILSDAAKHEYIGEPISQLAHALQAAHLAKQAGADDELILASLFHDVGHLAAPAGTPSMAGLGTQHHERHGAGFLRARGFSNRVTVLIEGHVEAKRYLVTRTPGYLARLSDASRGTLDWQGGPMSVEEVERFKSDPRMADKLRLRAWDEAAKDPGAQVPGLESYRPMIEAHLLRAWNSRHSGGE